MLYSSRDTLSNDYTAYGVKEKVDCSGKENDFINSEITKSNKIPVGIFEHKGFGGSGKNTYYRLKSVLSSEEIMDYLSFRQIELLTSIKRCILFLIFLVCAVIIAYLIILLFKPF